MLQDHQSLPNKPATASQNRGEMEEHEVDIGDWTAVTQRSDAFTNHLIRVIVARGLQSLYEAHCFVTTLFVYMPDRRDRKRFRARMV